MGCAASQQRPPGVTAGDLRQLLEPRFAAALPRDASLQASVLRAFPRGLAEPVRKHALFELLELEVDVLEDRLYTMLQEGGTHPVNLEGVLRALACTAAGVTLRSQRRRNSSPLTPLPEHPPPPPPLPEAAWEDRTTLRGGVCALRASFAFELYDLNDDGGVTAEEVTELVERTLAGNARTVHTTLKAMGATARGRLRATSFAELCANAPNFLYPAFALQNALVGAGRHAAEALRVLRALFEGTLLAPPPRRGHAEEAGSLRAREGSPPPPAARVVPDAPPRSPPPSAPPLSEAVGEELVARAFRAARLGRTAEVEAAVSRGGVSPAAAFEPHRATLLHVAAAHGHRSLCRRLLALGAPPRARDALGRSAAEVALAYRHWDTAAALQAAGVPVSPRAAADAAAEAAAWRQQQAAAEADGAMRRDAFRNPLFGAGGEDEAAFEDEWAAGRAQPAEELPEEEEAPQAGSDWGDEGGAPREGAWRSRRRQHSPR